MPRVKGIGRKNHSKKKKKKQRTHITSSSSSSSSSSSTTRRHNSTPNYVNVELLEGVTLSERERRNFIKGTFVSAGKPNAATFGGRDGLANKIKRDNPILFPNPNSTQDIILPVLKACAMAEADGVDYNGQRKIGSGGKNKKMDIADRGHDNALSAGVTALNKGLGMQRAVDRVNGVRSREGKSNIGPNVLTRIRDELGGERRAKGRHSQGSRDADSQVSKAWVALGTQLLTMIEDNDKPRISGRKRKRTQAAVLSEEQGGQSEREYFGTL